MKLSREEMIAKVNEKVTDLDLAIELIEDITDSMVEVEGIDSTELDRVRSDLEDMKRKYKERFLKAEEIPEEVVEEKEEKIVDVKEI